MEKRYVCIKQGEYRANIFNDFAQVVNNLPVAKPEDPFAAEEAEQVGFFTRMDYTFRLIRNRAANAETSFAIAMYSVDPENPDADPNMYVPVDFEKMMNVLDEGYDYVMFGFVMEQPVMPDYGSLRKSRIIVRDQNSRQLIDYDTKESLIDLSSKDSVVFLASFIGMTKFKGLPVYYTMLDNSLLRVSDGFDYDDAEHNTLYRLIDDHDGTIKENVLAPVIVEDNVTVVGKYNAFVDGDTVTIDFFEGLGLFMAGGEKPAGLPNVTVDSSFPYEILGTQIKFSIDASVGYVKIFLDGGPFFRKAGRKERPELEYIVHKKV